MRIVVGSASYSLDVLASLHQSMCSWKNKLDERIFVSNINGNNNINSEEDRLRGRKLAREIRHFFQVIFYFLFFLSFI